MLIALKKKTSDIEQKSQQRENEIAAVYLGENIRFNLAGYS